MVQWERPSRRYALILLILGSLVIPVELICWCLYYMYRKRNREQNHSANTDASADGAELENMASAEDEPAKSPTAV